MARARVVPQPRVILTLRDPTRLSRGLALVVFASTSAFACAPSTPLMRPVQTNQQVAKSTVEPIRADPLADGSSFQTHVSSRFHFSLRLPDGASFRIDDKTDRWFVATHVPTGSTLLLRAWKEYDLVNRTLCEERARLHRTLPEREGRAVVEERRVDVPPGYDTIVDVRVREHLQTPKYEGTVLAFGGWAHGCFAFVFATRDDDETTVAARLSTVVHGPLEHLTFENDLAPKRRPPDLKTPLRLDARDGPTL